MSTTTSNPRQNRRGGGRPSKGDRFTVTTKLPRSYEQKLHERADKCGFTEYMETAMTFPPAGPLPMPPNVTKD